MGNCGSCGGAKTITTMTSQQAGAMASAAQPRYEVTFPDGTVEGFGMYIDARSAQQLRGGTLREVR